MDNILEFKSVLRKKNRKSKSGMKRKKKAESEKLWSQHFELRLSERKFTPHLIKACLSKGKIMKAKGAIHYVLDNFHVVVDTENTTLLTAYFKTDYTQEEMELVA